MEFNKDPFGKAIYDYHSGQYEPNIVVESDICDDDVIPVKYLFRKEKDMPLIEQTALNLVKGRTLDIGACAGTHAKILQERGIDIEALEISRGASYFLKEQKIPTFELDFFDFKAKTYDTLLLLMNGIGLAGDLANLENTLLHAKSLIEPDGQILCDSSDIKYLYEDEDGSLWLDLNTLYYGNFNFRMTYKDQQSDWFKWLYVDFDNLQKAAKNCGMNVERIIEEDKSYLARITIKQ